MWELFAVEDLGWVGGGGGGGGGGKEEQANLSKAS